MIDKILYDNLIALFSDLDMLSQVYLVGGICRDHLLNIKSNDIDLCIEKITEPQLHKLNERFKLIGSSFPVFLLEIESSSGIEKIELAVARQERSTGNGHTDFDVVYGKNITIEDDLKRRDLTINSMAIPISDLNNIIDPYKGMESIRSKVLCHTSDAYADDPLRIFRTGRLASRFNFDVDKKTLNLMKDLSVQTEGLSGERIYIEVDKTFKSSNSPSIFFNVLKETENLDIWFPVISHLVGLTHIHYLDVYDHVMNVVDITKMSTDSIPALWGALYHDIGKIFTNDSQLPYHCDHDRTGLFLVPYISKRLKLPNNIKKTIEDTIKFHLTINEIYKMKPVQILKIIHHLQKRKTLSDVLSVVNSIKVSKGLSGIDGIIIKHIKNAEIVNMLNVPNHISDLFNGKNGIEISNRVLNWRVEEFNKRISLTDYI